MTIIVSINQSTIQRSSNLQENLAFFLHHYARLEKNFQVKVKQRQIVF